MNILQYLTLPADKANHATWGNVAAFLGVICARAAEYVGLPHVPARLAALAAVTAVALAKDVLYDRIMGRGQFDPWDIVATILGGMPVVATV